MNKQLAVYGLGLVKWILEGFGWIVEKTILFILKVITITFWVIYFAIWVFLFLTLWVYPKLWKFVNGAFLREIYRIFFRPIRMKHNQISWRKEYDPDYEVLAQYECFGPEGYKKLKLMNKLREKKWEKYFGWFERTCTDGVSM